MEMGSAAELRVYRVYRARFSSIALAWMGCAGFFVVGLSMVTIGPSQHGGVGSVVVGTLVLLLSAWLGSVLATNRLIVTAGGLVYWNYLRRRHIGWPEIRSFGVGPGRSKMQWPCLVIRLDNGSVTVTSLGSFTTTYPARVAGELTALQRELATGSPPGARPGHETGSKPLEDHPQEPGNLA
jgi:hypothetical protein